MSKHKVKHAAKKRLLVFGTISLVIIVYFLVRLCVYLYQVYDLTHQYNNLETKLIEEQDAGKKLTVQLERLKNPDYIAGYAREKFLYSKNDEYIIRHKKETEKIEEKQESTFSNFINDSKKAIIDFIRGIDYQYIIYGFIILIGIIIFKPKKKKGLKE